MIARLPSLIRTPAFILTMFGVVLMLPALLWGPGFTHSHLYNLMWTTHFGQEMAAGQFYERWLPGSFEGVGSPTFYFYPPFAYWISGAFHAIGFDVPMAVNLAGLTLLVASGLTMHHWLAARGTRPLLGAILYMAAPYHLCDIYVRGALAETAAFIWLPLIALAIDRLPTRRGIVLLATAYAGMLLSHLPLAMLTGLLLIAPMIGRRLWRREPVLLSGAAAGALAFALAAFYLIPALTLQSHVSIAMLWGPGYRATDWSVWNHSFEFFPCLVLGLILLVWPAARSFWGVMTILIALLSIRFIPYFWDVPMLNKAQFPWRALCIAEFAAITALVSRPWRLPSIAAAGTILIFPYMFTALVTATIMRLPDDRALIEQKTPDAPEYLPRGFDLSRVRSHDRWTDMTPWRSLPRGDAILVERAGPVTLGRAAFPVWRVTRDGRTVASTGPLLHFQATPGLYRIERVRIWQESVGAVISAIALLLTLLLILAFRRISHLSKFPSYSPS